MGATAQLASSLGRSDEQPNIALAEAIVSGKDMNSVRELVDLLNAKDKALKSDAVKTLYEVGARDPHLIAPFLAQFKNLLTSSDNRLVWGAMCAIDAITVAKPEAVFMIIPQIMAAVDRGSVITRDHAVKALAKLSADDRFSRTTMPLLLEQLRTCPANQFPMYAEEVEAVTKPGATKQLITALEVRMAELPTEAKRKRVEKVLRKLAKKG